MRLIDRASRAAVRIGLGRRSTALIETIGRRSGAPRVTPITNGLDGDVFWIVTEHGHKANYVRNIEADPRVRVNVGSRWRTGVAQIVDEDPEERLQQTVALNQRLAATHRSCAGWAPNTLSSGLPRARSLSSRAHPARVSAPAAGVVASDGLVASWATSTEGPD